MKASAGSEECCKKCERKVELFQFERVAVARLMKGEEIQLSEEVVLIGVMVDGVQVMFGQQDGRCFAVAGHGIDGIAAGETQKAGEADGDGKLCFGPMIVFLVREQGDVALRIFRSAERADFSGERFRFETAWRKGGGLSLRGFANLRVKGLAVGEEAAPAEGDFQARFHGQEARIESGPFFEKSERKRARVAWIEVLCSHLHHSSTSIPVKGRWVCGGHNPKSARRREAGEICSVSDNQVIEIL